MKKFKVVLSGQTHEKELLGERCAFVESLSFQNMETHQSTNKDIQKYSDTIARLNSAYKEIDVFLADELNRHNSPIYYPHDNPRLKALELGDFWLSSRFHTETIKLKNKPFPIMRWRDLTSEENFPNVLEIINSLYDRNQYFSSIVNQVCTKFVASIYSRDKKALENPNSSKLNLVSSPTFSLEELCAFSRSYILEECAATMMLRVKGYTNLCHIAKVNEAVAWAATSAICNLNVNHSNLINIINQNVLAINTVSKYKPCEQHTAKDSMLCSLFKPNPRLRRTSTSDIDMLVYSKGTLSESRRSFC